MTEPAGYDPEATHIHQAHPLDVLREVQHTLWGLANDVYSAWNRREPPQQALTYCLRYLSKEVEAVLKVLKAREAKS